jgi:hypothetical protein
MSSSLPKGNEESADWFLVKLEEMVYVWMVSLVMKLTFVIISFKKLPLLNMKIFCIKLRGYFQCQLHIL